MKKTALFLKEGLKSLLTALPDPAFYQYKYLRIHGRFCNFKNPGRFSEKIFHRMRYPSPLFSTLGDKVAARIYIAEAVGPQYLIPMFFSCKKVTPETFQTLPRTFVMKATNSAGQVRIVHDKNKQDLEELSRLANGWLDSRFPARTREKHYESIPPEIIFEQALLDAGRPPDDYKLNVFNSGRHDEPFIFIQHMQGRFESLTQNLYLQDWSPTPFALKLALLKGSSIVASKSESLDEMLRLAKKLAEPFGYLRVDFYVHEGKVYIGELTVTPGAGTYVFLPKRWDKILGQRFGWPERSHSKLDHSLPRKKAEAATAPSD